MVKDNITVAFVGEDDDAQEVLFKGFKDFFPSLVILIVKKGFEEKGDLISKELKKLNIDSKIQNVSEDPHMEEVFLEIKKLSELYSNETLVINVDCDYYTSCLALSAAFVNGIVAVGLLKEEFIVYPIMKFSYFNALNDKKMELLRIIENKKEISSMEELSKLAKMSLPLIAYHLRGNRDSKGLIELNLVETKKDGGLVNIRLTTLGSLIVKGGIDRECKK